MRWRRQRECREEREERRGDRVVKRGVRESGLGKGGNDEGLIRFTSPAVGAEPSPFGQARVS
jgi:hypothetical protein